jgi:hypothetical protein
MSYYGIMLTKSDQVRIAPILGLVAAVCLQLAFLGCSGGSHSGASPSIAFAALPLAPPASLGLGTTVSVAAIVSSDPGAQGVNWTVTCTPGTYQGADCGTITAHTASGYPTTYAAPGPLNTPSAIPAGGTVTITAASTTDPSQTISATIQITAQPPISIAFNQAPPASMLTGASANVIVYVGNDSTNAGADLSLTCGSPGACGSIVPAHTAGTVTSPAVYTAPLAVPVGGTVTITAVSTATATQSVPATVVATVIIKPAPLTITLSQVPAPNLPAGAATNLTAVVAFDPADAGVDWTASCSGTACGSFSLNHTASGQVTTYTAPPTPPPGSVVTITAASTTTPATVATAAVTITPANLRNDLLNGQYAFLLQGVKEGGPWAIAGSLLADGIGNIDSVTESFLGDNNSYSVSGTYFIESDGTGTITLNGAPTGLGYWSNGQQIFKVSVVSAGLMSIEEFDGYYDPNLHVAYGGTITGILEQQSVAAFRSPPLSIGSSYSFLLSGFGPQNGPAYYGGVLSGSSDAFTMDRSIAGVIDSIAGQVSFSSVSADHGSGNVTIGPYSLRYYIVDSGHLILIAGAGSTDFPAGHLYLQPPAAAAPAGSFAFTEAGATPLPQGSSPLALGGLFSADAQGNVTGLLDANVNGVVSSAPVSGTILVTSNGRGTLSLTGGAAQQFAVYPTAAHGVLMLELDPQMSGVGVVFPQTTGASATASLFSGNYAAAYQTLGQINAANGGVGSWNDFLGVLTADGISNLTGSMALDQFDESSQAFWTQTPNAILTGSFTAGPQGRFTGSFTIPPLATSQQVFYILDSSTVLSLGLDSGPSTGILQLQQF